MAALGPATPVTVAGRPAQRYDFEGTACYLLVELGADTLVVASGGDGPVPLATRCAAGERVATAALAALG